MVLSTNELAKVHVGVQDFMWAAQLSAASTAGEKYFQSQSTHSCKIETWVF